jgi:peptide/nickel transport system permease protein
MQPRMLDASVLSAQLRPRQRARTSRVFQLMMRNPLGTIGLLIVVSFILVAASGANLVGDPARLASTPLEGPSSAYWFGTDNLGRDYFARVVVGARSSITLALMAAAIGVTCAVVIGTLSAYAGGVIDLAVQRVIDMFLAFPGLVLLMLIVQALGRETTSIGIGLGLLYTSGLVRIVRSYVLSTMAQPYVESAPSRVLVGYRELGDSRRGRARVPRTRCPTAGPFLGPNAGRGSHAMAGPLPQSLSRHSYDARSSRIQPARRCSPR